MSARKREFYFDGSRVRNACGDNFFDQQLRVNKKVQKSFCKDASVSLTFVWTFPSETRVVTRYQTPKKFLAYTQSH